MFFYDDPNFSNLLIDRIIGRIYYEYDACVYAEVGEYKPELLVDFEKSLISKCQKWGIEFTYEIEFVSSYLDLYNKWIEKDIVYITERKEEYKKLLYNDYSEYIDEYINNSKYKKKFIL